MTNHRDVRIDTEAARLGIGSMVEATTDVHGPALLVGDGSRVDRATRLDLHRLEDLPPEEPGWQDASQGHFESFDDPEGVV